MKQSHLDDLRDVTTRQDLLAGVSRLGESLGFAIATVAFRQGRYCADPSYTSVTNAPPIWVEKAGDRELQKRDPVFHRLNTSLEPFFYDADFYAAHNAGALWELVAPHGFVNGVSASLCLGPDRLLFWGFDTDEPLPTDESRRLRLLGDNMLVGVTVCAAAVRVLSVPAPVLTDRQLEVLEHVRAGRSSISIACVMAISEETVNFHMKRIRAVLGVTTRHQAVSKAEALGLLT